MRISELTMPELKYLEENCNFTKDETDLFRLRSRDIPLEECAERMDVSIATANRLHKRIKDKVNRIHEMCQSGFAERT